MHENRANRRLGRSVITATIAAALAATCAALPDAASATQPQRFVAATPSDTGVAPLKDTGQPQARAATARGTLAVARTSVTVGARSNYTFTYRAASTVRSKGTIQIVFPIAWTTPQNRRSSAAGYLAVSRGTCAQGKLTGLTRQVSSWTATLSINCAAKSRLTVSYRSVTAPKRAATYAFSSRARFAPWSQYIPFASSPRVQARPGPATSLRLTNQPATQFMSGSAVNPINVAILDRFGNPTTTPTPITLATTSGSPGAVYGTTTVAPTGTVATFSNVRVHRSGSGYRLIAASAGLSTAPSDPFTVEASWRSTTSLPHTLNWAPMTLLNDGRALTVGSDYDGSAPVPGAFTFDPTTESWTETAPPQSGHAYGHVFTLPDGRALAVGSNYPVANEIYDPVENAWEPAAPFNVERNITKATQLPDGRVLVVGGTDEPGPQTGELYDPASDSWTLTGPLTQPHRGGALVAMTDGRVLVAGGGGPWWGGAPSNDVEILDPETLTWSAAPTMAATHVAPSGTLLADGRVLIAGGSPGHGTTVEIFNPATGSWTTGARGDRNGVFQEAELLTDGRVLMLGGGSEPEGGGAVSTSQVYDPRSDSFSTVQTLPYFGSEMHTQLLADGSVLIAGGRERTGAGLYGDVPPVNG